MNKAIIIFWTVAVILVAATLLLILSEMQLVMLERKKKEQRGTAKKKAAPPPASAPVQFVPIAIIPQIVEQTPEPEPEPKPQKPPRRRRRRGLVDLPAASILGTIVGSVLAGTVAALPFLLKEKNRKGTKKKKHSRREILHARSSKRMRLLLR